MREKLKLTLHYVGLFRMLSNVKTSFQIFQSVGPRNVVEGGPGLPEQHHRLLHLQSTGVERSGGGYICIVRNSYQDTVLYTLDS